ncbi:MAG: hypothetical protein E7109_05930 [Bacteroidales bacterium]|nr:hypothetical protein [Bacteroidales bacterium]
MNYWNREQECERLFLEGGPFYIVTTENLPWLLFACERDFMDGANMVAVSVHELALRLLADVEMNNHLHFVFEGAYEQVLVFVERFRKMMSRYQLAKGSPSLNRWDIQIKSIDNLKYLRNALLYVFRNPSVAMRNCTPLGYKWSSAQLMFNENLYRYSQGVPYNSLTYREKRLIAHSRELILPDSYRVLDGMILRECFVDYKRAESFFESAHQFFYQLGRKVESDAETARWIGEKILLPNEDVFGIVSAWYNVQKTSLLSTNQRLEAARRMKAELMSNNKQIAQVLRIPIEQVDQFFPVAQ